MRTYRNHKNLNAYHHTVMADPVDFYPEKSTKSRGKNLWGIFFRLMNKVPHIQNLGSSFSGTIIFSNVL
jgi:hypothetical protein